MRLIPLALTIALAACTSPAPRGGGSGLPEVAMRARGDNVVPPGRGGPLALAVRSFRPGPDGDWAEVAGARCSVAGGEFYRAELVTPARLVLPDLGPDAPPLRADCATAAARGSAQVAPVYPWPAEGRPSAATRIVWGAGWWDGFQQSGPVRYPDLAVGMR